MEVVILGSLFSGLIGLVIGKRKKREAAGFFLGAILGPIGWLLVALGPSHGKKCPECMGVVEEGAKKCRHCGSNLVSTQQPHTAPSP